MEVSTRLEELYEALEECQQLILKLEDSRDSILNEIVEIKKSYCGLEHCSVNCDDVEHCHMTEHCDKDCPGRFCGIKKDTKL
jgi:hypothetical protein